MRAALLLTGLGKQSLNRTDLAPMHVKTRVRVEMLQERGTGWMWGCRMGRRLVCTEAQVHGKLRVKVFVRASLSLTPGFPMKL